MSEPICPAIQGSQMRGAPLTIGPSSPASLEGAGQRVGWVGAVLVGLCWAGGCSSTPKWASTYGLPPESTSELCSPERLAKGYVVILPGILGDNPTNPGLTKGLLAANVPLAIQVHDWTRGPLFFVQNLRDLERNQREARKLAEKIIAYQDRYPFRPVHLIGHSAGGSLAVLALEALPPGRKVTSAILLAPSLTPDYDLRSALSHTESGIYNFYSYLDIPALILVTTVLGTTEGRHAVAAGALGFKVPRGLDAAQRREYEQGLIQRSYRLEMLATGHLGGHRGWTNPAFVRRQLAPLLSTAEVAQLGTSGLPNTQEAIVVQRLPPTRTVRGNDGVDRRNSG